MADAERLVASDLAADMLRICVEPVGVDCENAVGFVGEIHAVLDRAGMRVPRLHHGDGEAA